MVQYICILKKVRKNNMLINKKIELGNEVYLTDPRYDTTTLCQQLLKNVKSGKWVVDYEYNEYEDGTQQEVILSIAHEDYGTTIFEDLEYLIKDIMKVIIMKIKLMTNGIMKIFVIFLIL